MKNRLHPGLLIAFALALFFAALFIFSGDGSDLSNGFWAFSFLHYVPLWLRLALGVLVLTAPFVSLLGEDQRPHGWPPRLQALPLWPIALIGGVLFWFLRERTHHGDALLKLELLAAETVATDPYVWKEPLDALLAYAATSMLASFGQSPETAVALLSVLAGVFYLWSALYVAHLLGRSLWIGLLILVALLATGSSLLWFGHIENYSLVTAMSFLATALAIGFLKGDKPLWPVGLAAGAAISLHPQAIFTLPALLLLFERERWPKQVGVLLVTGLVVPIATIALLLLAGAPTPWASTLSGQGYGGDSQLFWTIGQASAPEQLWQDLNNLLLLVPLFPLWLVAGVWALIDVRTRRDRVFLYLSVLAAGLLLYLLTFQNDLPRWRDWDLYAIVGPGVTLWGVYAWLALMDVSQERHNWLWPILTTGMVFASVLSVAWIGVNARYTLIRPNSEERDLYQQRYQVVDLLDLLPGATVTPPEPICADDSGCERVAATEFVMPHNGDVRSVLFAHAPARIELPLDVPGHESFLWLSPALDPQSWDWGGDGVTFTVAVQHGDGLTTLWSRHFTPEKPAHRGWLEVFVSLNAYRGQPVTLILETSPGPAGNDAGDRAGWGMPWLMRGVVDERFAAE